MHTFDQSWLPGAHRCPSPNCDDRPADSVVDLLVIHNISLPPAQFGESWIEDFFLNKLDPSQHPYFREIQHLKVSAHFLIKRDGEILQFVPLDKRAWHAGKSSFQNRDCCNDYSVGIELEGTDNIPYTDAQYQNLAELSKALLEIFPAMTKNRITGHEHIAPDRKTDPGPAFDWPRYLSLLDAH
ncbi:MAG TPA: 1,6-anhydro-N-acetylmuramyl-L-alanine amidase AmpD [Thiolapillus brandeum]|uniref:1,6-anhydro-N-acetylmuramyl-L-alanine amidase AmpD n=1 Tax=Thiolapillus brandeum TaxID=1076588 RepID=A0A831K5P2_9GAMM|nr:1,6-anhydro-N-acetylmuramyl-L-alanine amidase AmpD [Thiolapillus brandeum]